MLLLANKNHMQCNIYTLNYYKSNVYRNTHQFQWTRGINTENSTVVQKTIVQKIVVKYCKKLKC